MLSMIQKLDGDDKLNGPQNELKNDRKVSLKLNRYGLVGASVRGKMHVRKGTTREDAFVVYRDGDWVVVAVSDGVGSSKYSALGASFAVNDVCENILNNIGDLESSKDKRGISKLLHKKHPVSNEDLGDILKSAYGVTLANLKQYAQELCDAQNPPNVVPSDSDSRNEIEHNVDIPDASNSTKRASDSNSIDSCSLNATPIALSDLHCTLLVFVLNVKSGIAAAAQIGDGLILGLDVENKAVSLIDPIVPDQMGQVYPITMNDWGKYWSFQSMSAEVSDRYDTFYLMTDGVADDCQYGPPEDILQRWANDMNTEIRKYDLSLTDERLRKYLTDYEAKGSYDDRTLVVLYRIATDKNT